MGGVGYTALGFILGGVVFMVTGSLFPHTYGSERYGDRLYSILKTRSLVIVGLIIYNIAAGLLIGAGFADSLKFGVIVMLAAVLQNIPRGVAIREPLSDSMTGSHRGLFIMLLAGIPAMIGAAVTFAALTSMVPVFLSTSMAFCSGALLFIVADQMIPIVKGYSRMHEIAIALFLGIFIGVLMLGIG
jgi:zinc transporter ZupT